ncbi:signal recognition particle receptor beta subunit-domain-containing protein [Microdochium trichocladiopsis]|uniref:Signal recognition particle receptor subunit beta n=1 Tax=Microdochium trichocladiopsis TaxID=1682393 RepID=A0A9P8YFL7_9PEZI|nr:signal recognition particle receptor beta subunit-domain-containing protein [Microdochium trichocladiopsis]KAH7038032.1 signal recognition particle receptor beta subunit-domain-containing protein [Microdochium trichocladiopsis]
MATFTEVLEFLLTPSKTVFIAGGLIVLLVPILLHLFITRSTPYTSLPSILLTALLTLLERGDAGSAATHTSQVPHSVELTVSSEAGSAPLNYRDSARDDAPGSHKKFLLLDSPGHPKLRNQALAPIAAASSKSTASSSSASASSATSLRGIVYVVDAATLDDLLAPAAAYLYDVLLALQKRAASSSSSSRAPRPIPLLVAANKADLFTAMPASLVRSSLEAEITRVRSFRSKGMLDSGVGVDDIGSEENDAWLGAYGTEKFTFAQMREFDIEVEVVAGSVLEGKVDKWWEWIAERI